MNINKSQSKSFSGDGGFLQESSQNDFNQNSFNQYVDEDDFLAALERKDKNFLKSCADENKKLSARALKKSSKFVSLILHRMDKTSAWLVRQLAENGPDLPLLSAGDNAMMILARHATPEFCLIYREDIMGLASRPESVHLTNDEGETALMIAIEEGKHDLVRILLETGSDINHTSVSGQSVIDKIKKTSDPLKTIENLVDWISENNKFSVFIQKELREMFYEALLSGDDALIAKLRPFADDLRDEVARAIKESRQDIFERIIALGVVCADTDIDEWRKLAREHKNGRVLGRISLMVHQTKK